MKPVLTAAEYRRIDQAWDGDLAAAMGRAGHAVALAAVRHGAGYGTKVVVLAGPGNNGGDGYVAARHLARREAFVQVQALAPPKTALAAAAAEAASGDGIPVSEIGAPDREADLVIDAVFGGGGRGRLPSPLLDWMSIDAPVVAVDFPTGLDPDTGEVEERAFVAVETVSFGSLKTGHVLGRGPDHCGGVTVADIGISGGYPSFWVAEAADAPRPARKRATHKWAAGAVLVVGGSSGLVGASVLAGRGALAFGAGSVYVASPRPDLVSALAPELPVLETGEAGASADRFDVVLAGPGLDPSQSDEVMPIVAKAERVVLDAGALTPEMLSAAVDSGGEVIVTPHGGEFRRLAGQGGGGFAVRALARQQGVTVLLKGNPTMVSDGGVPVLVTSGGPELASIGTGDVLAGMISALWARGLSPLEAAISGAYWHGVAGSELIESGTVTAPRLADEVGRYAW